VSPRPAPEPYIAVIFGASGDLAQRKLLPALHNLQVDRDSRHVQDWLHVGGLEGRDA
jgi:glucose-6-phosphate 1-dehydrogenase